MSNENMKKLEELAYAKMCDSYCKYPNIADEFEILRICENCPLTKLSEIRSREDGKRKTI